MEVVIFKIRNISYATPSEKVLDVVKSISVVQIPYVSIYVNGSVNLAVLILIQIDLKKRLGADNLFEKAQGVLLEVVSQGYLFALHVDMVQELTEIHVEEISPFFHETLISDSEIKTQSNAIPSSDFVIGESSWQEDNIVLFQSNLIYVISMHELTHVDSNKYLFGAKKK